MVNIPSLREQVTRGLVYQQYEPHIHCFVFTDMSDESVDAAYDRIVALDNEHEGTGIHAQYLCILDDVPYTPYMLKRIKQLLDLAPPDLVDSSAVVTDTFLSRVLQTIVMPVVQNFVGHTIEFFTTETEAFEWLEKRRKQLED